MGQSPHGRHAAHIGHNQARLLALYHEADSREWNDSAPIGDLRAKIRRI
jgi:hypothetical protein